MDWARVWVAVTANPTRARISAAQFLFFIVRSFDGLFWFKFRPIGSGFQRRGQAARRPRTLLRAIPRSPAGLLVFYSLQKKIGRGITEKVEGNFLRPLS